MVYVRRFVYVARCVTSPGPTATSTLFQYSIHMLSFPDNALNTKTPTTSCAVKVILRRFEQVVTVVHRTMCSSVTNDAEHQQQQPARLPATTIEHEVGFLLVFYLNHTCLIVLWLICKD